MKNVLITGITSGIGLATACLLAERGFRIFGTMRSLEKNAQLVSELRARYPGIIDVFPMEITSDRSVRETFDAVAAAAGVIDIAVCNAGTLVFGSIEDTPLEAIRYQYDTNVLGTLRVIKALLPDMRQRRSGRIVVVSSLAGLMTMPYATNYSATKAAIDSIVDGMRQEMKQFGIKVVGVRPGDVKTRLNDNAMRCAPDDSCYGDELSRCWRVLEREVDNGLPSERVAEKIHEVITMESPKPFYAVANRGQVLVPFLNRVLGGVIKERMLRSFYELDDRARG